MLTQRSKTLLRWVLGISLFAYIVSQLRLELLATQLATLAFGPLLLSLLAHFAVRVLVAAKWYFLVRVGDPSFRFVDAVAIHFIGGAAGIALPLVGVDAVVGYAYYRHRGQAGTAISTVLADRLIGIYTVIFLAAVGLLFNSERFAGMPGLLWSIFVLVLSALVGPVVLLWLAKSQALRRRLHLPSRLTWLIKEVVKGFEDLRDRGMPMVLVNVVLSFVTQLARVLAVLAVAIALHEQPSFLDFTVLTPLVFLISMVPLTVGGLGFSQGAYIVLFGLVGIAPEVAFVMSIVNAMLTKLTVLPGVVMLIRGRKPPAAGVKAQGRAAP